MWYCVESETIIRITPSPSQLSPSPSFHPIFKRKWRMKRRREGGREGWGGGGVSELQEYYVRLQNIFSCHRHFFIFFFGRKASCRQNVNTLCFDIIISPSLSLSLSLPPPPPPVIPLPSWWSRTVNRDPKRMMYSRLRGEKKDSGWKEE